MQFGSLALGVTNAQVGARGPGLASPSGVPLWARPWPQARGRLRPLGPDEMAGVEGSNCH